MIFEGSEKKAELIIKGKDLLAVENGFWEKVVSSCQAKILSFIESDSLKAFLLSESSLFIWKDRLLLITCGTTTLVESVLFVYDNIVKELGDEAIECVIFQRKNEYCGNMQKSSFFSDSKRLKEIIPSKSYRFGNFDEHHLFLFHSAKPYSPVHNDETIEVLTYSLSKKVLSFFNQNNLKSQDYRNFFQFEKFFPNFKFDDYAFEPFGYSINGVYGDDYFTIHVTPEDCHSFVSFESSLNENQLEGFLSHFIELLEPDSYDYIGFSPNRHHRHKPKFGHILKKRVEENIDCGYQVSFSHYYLPENTLTTAVHLD